MGVRCAGLWAPPWAGEICRAPFYLSPEQAASSPLHHCIACSSPSLGLLPGPAQVCRSPPLPQCCPLRQRLICNLSLTPCLEGKTPESFLACKPFPTSAIPCAALPPPSPSGCQVCALRGGPSPRHRQRILHLLSHPVRGLGLSIARYVIPAGYNPNKSPGLARSSSRLSRGSGRTPGTFTTGTRTGTSGEYWLGAVKRGATADAVSSPCALVGDHQR